MKYQDRFKLVFSEVFIRSAVGMQKNIVQHTSTTKEVITSLFFEGSKERVGAVVNYTVYNNNINVSLGSTAIITRHNVNDVEVAAALKVIAEVCSHIKDEADRRAQDEANKWMLEVSKELHLIKSNNSKEVRH